MASVSIDVSDDMRAAPARPPRRSRVRRLLSYLGEGCTASGPAYGMVVAEHHRLDQLPAKADTTVSEW